MKPAFWSRRLHKWLGLLVGIQALLWMASGVYMTAISIDIIHGDHLAHAAQAPLSPHGALVPPAQLAQQFPGMTGFRLKRVLDMDVYEVRHPAGAGLVDASSGRRLDPLAQPLAEQIARHAYHGDGALSGLRLLPQPPQEVASRKGPLWRADFNDGHGTALYVSPATGDVVAKRHTLWRVYDFLWMLHIMDYDTRSDVNNTLLRIASIAGTLFALSGLWLLWFTVRRKEAR